MSRCRCRKVQRSIKCVTRSNGYFNLISNIESERLMLDSVRNNSTRLKQCCDKANQIDVMNYLPNNYFSNNLGTIFRANYVCFHSIQTRRGVISIMKCPKSTVSGSANRTRNTGMARLDLNSKHSLQFLCTKFTENRIKCRSLIHFNHVLWHFLFRFSAAHYLTTTR